MMAQYAIIFINKEKQMTKRDKLVSRIFEGKTVSNEEAVNLLLFLGFKTRKKTRTGSSHIVLVKNEQSITLVLNRKELKGYQIQLLQDILTKEGY
jgi:hypothetical protein